MKKRIMFLALSILIVVFAFTQSQQKTEKASTDPPESGKGRAIKILGYDVAPCTPDKTEMRLKVMSDEDEYPTNTGLGYKGVVMANFNATDAADELFADFGSSGLFYYDNGSWAQQSGVNPDGMISATIGSATDDELIVDFGSAGVWMWNLGGAWTQLTGANPTSMFATDDDQDGKDEIMFDFGSLGVWRYDWDTFSWTQYSNLNPYEGLRMDAWIYGWQEGVFSFPTHGVWNMYGSGPFYNQLTGTVNSNDDHVSAQITNTAGAEDLVMDFGGLGIWLYYEDGSGWTQISPMSPNRVREVMFVGTSDYELLIEDNAGGLYWWNWGGSTTLITSTAIGPSGSFCEPFDWDGTDGGDEEVMIPWQAGGASMFDYSAGSTMTLMLNTLYFVKFMVRGDYYGRGYNSTLAFVFTSASPSPGLWLYDKTNGYTLISTLIPDGDY